MEMASKSNGDRADLLIRRALAPILFLLAAVCALPAVLGTVMFLSGGRWVDLKMAAGTGAIAGMLGWLGWLIWIGRPIPGWFIFGIFTVPGAAFLVWALVVGQWGDAFPFACVWLPGVATTWTYWSTISAARPKKPAMPNGIDDFA